MRYFVNGLFDQSEPNNKSGSKNSQAKLDERMVFDIRRKWLAGRSGASLAVEYDVNETAISKIISNRNWQHVGWPSVQSIGTERRERDRELLDVPRAGIAASLLISGSLLLLAGFAPLSAPLERAPRGLRAIFRMVFRRRDEKRERRAQMLLRFVPPTEPDPPSSPASSAIRAALDDGDGDDGYSDSGDESDYSMRWPVRPIFALPGNYPPALANWRSPRIFGNQAIPVRFGDRAWRDEDVQAIASSKRFRLIIGGKSNGSGSGSGENGGAA